MASSKPSSTSAAIQGRIWSVSMFGIDNPATSMEVLAVVNDRGSSVCVRIGAGSKKDDIVSWTSTLLTAYLDGRDAGNKKQIMVEYDDSAANQILSITYPAE
jgi:hypothetical protein